MRLPHVPVALRVVRASESGSAVGDDGLPGPSPPAGPGGKEAWEIYRGFTWSRSRAITRPGPGQSAGERTQHEGGKITACGPGNIKVLWLTRAEAYWLSGDLGKRAVAAEVPRRGAGTARPVP